MAASRAFRERIQLARCRSIMVEEGQDDRGIEILDTEGRRFDAIGLMSESQEQAKGVSVRGMRA